MPCAEDLAPPTSLTRPARDTLSQETAPSFRIQGTWEKRPARDRGGPLSHLGPRLLDSDQAGLEDSGADRRVTSARSCPNFRGLVLPAQPLPSRGRRVTAPPKPPRKLPQVPPGAAAPGIPAAADAPPHESPGAPSRGEHTLYADAAQDDTPASSSSASLQQIDGAETTSGKNNTASLSPSPGVWTTTRDPNSPTTPAPDQTPGGGSILASRPGSLLESA